MTKPPTRRSPAHPGRILLEQFLQPLAILQAAFANAIGVPSQRVNDIVNKKRGVTPDTALRFEAALGVSAEFWQASLDGPNGSLARRPSMPRRAAILADGHRGQRLLA